MTKECFVLWVYFVLTLDHEYVVETNDGMFPLSDSVLKARGPACFSNWKPSHQDFCGDNNFRCYHSQEESQR